MEIEKTAWVCCQISQFNKGVSEWRDCMLIVDFQIVNCCIFSLFEISRELISGTIFFQLFIGILHMSATYFEMELVRHEFIKRFVFFFWAILIDFSQVIMKADFKVLLVSLAVFLSTGVVFIYCFMGTFTTEQFLLYADISYESMWYKFPVKLQKYLALILADSQRPRYFDGLNLIELSLVTFTKVNVNAFYLHH